MQRPEDGLSYHHDLLIIQRPSVFIKLMPMNTIDRQFVVEALHRSCMHETREPRQRYSDSTAIRHFRYSYLTARISLRNCAISSRPR